jgi:hypothetical protein
MMNRHTLRAAAAITLTTMCCHLHAAECKLAILTPENGALKVDGIGTVSLGEADNAAQPKAWQGPVSAGACALDVGLIEAPIIGTSGGPVYLTTYSGALRKVVLVDAAACKVVWRSAPFVGEVNVAQGRLKLGKTVVALDGRCLPKQRR